MGHAVNDWTYSASVDPQREHDLRAVPSYQRIVDCIVREMKVVAAGWELGADDPEVDGCWRPAFTLRVHASTFDAFHNSPRGYRGQFYDDEHIGNQANRTVLHVVEPKLIAVWNAECRTDARLRRSLSHGSAKIWICERANDTDPGARDAIWSQRWEDAITQGHQKACLAGYAPTGRDLEVKGAWLAPDGVEHVATTKKWRSRELHCFGFS